MSNYANPNYYSTNPSNMLQMQDYGLVGGGSFTKRPDEGFPVNYGLVDSMDFAKRPDNLYAGQGSWLDSLQGYGQDAIDGFKGINWLGGTDDKGMKINGALGSIFGAAQGIGNIYMGMKNYNLAKRSLDNNEKQFALNYGAQKQLINNQMESKQRTMAIDSPGNTESVDSYMKKHRIA